MADNLNMEVSISSILRTFTSDVSFFQPIYEAIANSFDAGARNIQINFYKRQNILECNFIDKIEIIDDGEGFTDENLNSFYFYMSEKKLSIGGKGVGRFTWLKIFKRIFIESETNDSSVYIDFSSSFDKTKDVHLRDKTNNRTYTKITFDEIISSKHANIEINLGDFKKKILDYFILKFYEFKNLNKIFKIELNFENDKKYITEEDIGEMKSKPFVLHDFANQNEYEFKVNYSFIDNAIQTTNECFLCGNGRLVEKYDLNKILSSLPENKHIKVLVHSKYFDERINNDRTAFTFSRNENNPNIVNPIPFPEISSKIIETLDIIVLEEFPFLSENNNRTIDECIDERPYLSKYILKDDSLIKRKKEILTKAQKEFEREKEDVRSNFVQILNEKNVDSNVLLAEFDKMNELSNRELAQYFIFRQVIIDSLKKINDSDDKIEKHLHSLFFKMKSVANSSDPMKNKFQNCIWLLDDKYMSFDRLYSDKKVADMFEKTGENDTSSFDGIRPDMAIFYSNHDVVVVEFKSTGTDENKKIDAYTEINRNIGIIAERLKDVNNIYGYVITKFDEKFKYYLSRQPGIKVMFSSGKDPIYFLYNDNIKDANGNSVTTFVYFISADTIYSDANSRNKLFIDIIKN